MITPNGKEIEIIRDPRAYFKVQFKTGGELPEELAGLFTSHVAAEKAINVYLDSKKKKVNAKS